MARRADVIMLGCTHYPFVRPLIADVVGADVALIDTGAAVVKRVRHVLAERDLLNDATAPGTALFWTSGEVATAERVTRVVWSHGVPVDVLPEGGQ